MLIPEVTLRLHPHELHYNLGCVLQQQAELEQAAAHYRRAILLGRQAGDAESCANAHHNLGVILAQQERWLAATYHYRRAIALRQNHLLAYCNLGTALLQQGETTAAIQVYQQAIQQIAPPQQAEFPVWAGLYHNLSQALQKQGRLSDAIAAYRQSLAIDPDKAEVHYNLGRAFFQQGNRVKAVQCFQKALQLNPDLAVAEGDSGLIWLTLGQFDRAIHSFRQAIVPHQAFVVAYCNWIEGHWIEAAPDTETDEFLRARFACAQFLTALLQNQPNLDDLSQSLVQALTHWGNVLTAYGGNTQLRYAEQLYQHALQLQPQQIGLYRRLVQCLNQQQRFAAAIVICYLALAIAPQDPEIYAALNDLQQRSQFPQSEFRQENQSTPLLPNESIESGDRSPQAENCFALPLQKDCQIACSESSNGQSATACGGLNCEPCLQQMTRSFEPVRLGEGVYQLSHPSPLLQAWTGDTSLDSPVGETAIDRPITIIKNGRVWVAPQTSAWQACRTIAVFSAEGELMPHLSRSYPGQLPNCQHSHVPLQGVPAQLPQPMRVKGKVAVLSSLSGSVYFHWMTDLLPRLELLQRQVDLHQINYFLVNSHQRSFQRETLQAFGIDSDRIIESDRYPYVQAEQFIVPEFAGELGWMQPWAIQFLRRKFLSEAHPEPSSNVDQADSPKFSQSHLHREIRSFNAPPLIYLSRSDARYRRLLNEEEVLNYLRPYGFVSLTLDSLSVAEQATLFANARVIVAPHGSSLTNLVFCQPGTQVVELTSPNYLRHYFWRISRLLNLSHYVIFGEVFSCHFLRQLMYPNSLLEDVWIDVDRLDRVIQKVFDNPFPASTRSNFAP